MSELFENITHAVFAVFWHAAGWLLLLTEVALLRPSLSRNLLLGDNASRGQIHVTPHFTTDEPTLLPIGHDMGKTRDGLAPSVAREERGKDQGCLLGKHKAGLLNSG